MNELMKSLYLQIPFRLVFMANVADPAPWANRLIEFVNQGGVLVLSMGDNVSP